MASRYGAKRRRRRIVAIGDMNEKITLQTRTLNTRFQSSSHEDDVSFTDVQTVWALVETTRGVQEFDGVELRAAYTHRFYIRYTPDIDQMYWVEYNSKRYDIVDVENLDERKEFLMLKCRLTGTNEATNEAAWG